MTNFEDHLWQEVVTEYGDDLARSTVSRPTRERPQRSALLRRPAFLTGTGLAIAGLAAAGIFALGAFNAGAAYAVTKNPDGTYSVSLSEFSALPALNQKLAQDGIPATAVPMSASCTTSDAGEQIWDGHLANPPTDTLTFATSRIPSGDVLVVGAGQTASGQTFLVATTMAAPGPSCLASPDTNS
jgi:hypothetical protein